MKLKNYSFGIITIEHVWAAVILAGIFIFNNSHPIRLYDFWLAIAQGREMIVSGAIPNTDVFSFSHYGAPFLSSSAYWLADIFWYFVYVFGGSKFVIFINTVIIVSAYAILLMVGWRASGQLRYAALGVVFAAALGFNDWNVRPQVFSYLFGALILWITSEYEATQRKGLFFYIPLVILFWVNTHPSYPIGLIIIGGWAVSNLQKAFLVRSRKIMFPSAVVLGASVLACFITPHGMDNVRMVFTLVGSPIQSHITEWAPPSFDTLGGSLFFFGLLGVSLLMGFSSKRISVVSALYFLAFAYFGLNYIRSSVWFGLVMAPFVSMWLSELMPLQHSIQNVRSRFINRLLVGLVFALALISLPWFKPFYEKSLSSDKAGDLSREIPVAAVQYLLDNHLPANIFHEMGFGSYLMWAAYPKYQVFIDPRFDIKLYPISFWNEYDAINRGDNGWENSLAKYDIATLMLSPKFQADLISAVEKSSAWEKLYEDEVAIIWVKK